MKALLLLTILSLSIVNTLAAQFIDPKKIDPGFYGIVYRDTIYCSQIIYITDSRQLMHNSKVKYIYKSKDVWYDDNKNRINILMYKPKDEPWQEI